MLNYLHGREARPSSVGWILLKTFIQTIIFWSVFLVLIPWAIIAMEDFIAIGDYHFHSSLTLWTGVVLFCLGGSLGICSSTIMAFHGRGTPLPADCPSKLVIAGPYRYVRNPMAIGGLSQGVAVGLILGSSLVIVFAILGGPIWHFFVSPWEEEDLQKRFGEPYERYRDGVKCWLPRRSGFHLPNELSSKYTFQQVKTTICQITDNRRGNSFE